MLIRRVYRYRLYPTKAQEQELLGQIELCRQLYNKALWWRQGAWERSGGRVSFKDQVHALVPLKRDMPEYAAISYGVLEDVLKRVDLAFRAFFRRCKAGEKPGYPRAKGAGWYKSITVPRSREFELTYSPGARFGRLSFKGFSGLRVRMHRPLPEDASVRRVMVKQEASGAWYAIFGWDMESGEPPERPQSSVGVDLGLHSFTATSDGETVEAPKHLRRSARKLRKAQRSLSRKQRGSNRRRKARRRAAKVHERVRNQRRDFLHNQSRRLVDRHTLIAVEDLRVSNMAKNRYLAKSIADAGWAEFVHMLTYKAESAGAEIVVVDPRHTSQDCSGCGQRVEKSLAVRIHRCECGTVLDRDVNAARNVLQRAVQAWRGGDRVAVL